MYRFTLDPVNSCPLVLEFIDDLPIYTNIIILILGGYDTPYVIGTPAYMREIEGGILTELQHIKLGTKVKGPSNKYLPVCGITRWLVDAIEDQKFLIREH